MYLAKIKVWRRKKSDWRALDEQILMPEIDKSEIQSINTFRDGERLWRYFYYLSDAAKHILNLARMKAWMKKKRLGLRNALDEPIMMSKVENKRIRIKKREDLLSSLKYK